MNLLHCQDSSPTSIASIPSGANFLLPSTVLQRASTVTCTSSSRTTTASRPGLIILTINLIQTSSTTATDLSRFTPHKAKINLPLYWQSCDEWSMFAQEMKKTIMVIVSNHHRPHYFGVSHLCCIWSETELNLKANLVTLNAGSIFEHWFDVVLQ